MKKLLFIISLCPTTNMLAMLTTRTAPLARTAALISRSLHTTKRYADHQHSATFPVYPPKLLASYIAMRYLKEETVRENLRKKARENADAETFNLKKRFERIQIALEQEKDNLPFKQYCDMSTKIRESLMGGKEAITERLATSLTQIDNKSVTLDPEVEKELKLRFNI